MWVWFSVLFLLRLGPHVGSWCMHYKVKHHYFKHLAVVTCKISSICHIHCPKDTKKACHTDWSHLREVLPHSLKRELKLGQVKFNTNTKEVHCNIISNCAFVIITFLFCFFLFVFLFIFFLTVGRNSYWWCVLWWTFES